MYTGMNIHKEFGSAAPGPAAGAQRGVGGGHGRERPGAQESLLRTVSIRGASQPETLNPEPQTLNPKP